MFRARCLPLRVVERIQQVNLSSRSMHVIVYTHPFVSQTLVWAAKSLCNCVYTCVGMDANGVKRKWKKNLKLA